MMRDADRMKVKDILVKEEFSKEEIVTLLSSEGEEKSALYAKSVEVKERYIGNKVWLRGLIEFSNICGKDCLYCGIRKGNRNVKRYSLSDKEILEAAKYAFENRYGSIVLQSGELENEAVSGRIENLVQKIRQLSDGNLGITLSVGEQVPDVYRRWFEAGAHRYLLRIEATNEELYRKIHPDDSGHHFRRRLDCLKNLQEIGYQTGTGVMIGLPFQTLDDLAGDLQFMQRFNIDMCGMGPYIEHADTPLVKYRSKLLPLSARLDLSLKMTAILRIMMKDINIAAATALQAIDPLGREKAVRTGANIIMPNITPLKYRKSYQLYENKPCTDESAEDCQACLEARINMSGSEIIFGEWGDSLHYERRIANAGNQF